MILSCAKEPIDTKPSSNKDVPVSLLFEYEGCKIYRFYDDRFHYFTNCTQTISTQSTSCGKGCTKYYDEKIETK